MAETITAPKPPARPRRSPKVKALHDLAGSYFAAVAARDAEAMAAHYSDDVIEDLVPVGILRGPAAARAFFEEMFAAVPDMAFRVERVTAEDSFAAVQWRAEGTFDGGPFQGIEPTGRRIDLRGCDILEAEDGKITRVTAYWDGADFARAIGMLPPQDSGAETLMRTAFNGVTRLRRAAGSIGAGR